MNISRHFPNLISGARIIATPILIYLALLPTWASDVQGLYWLLESQRLGTA